MNRSLRLLCLGESARDVACAARDSGMEPEWDWMGGAVSSIDEAVSAGYGEQDFGAILWGLREEPSDRGATLRSLRERFRGVPVVAVVRTEDRRGGTAAVAEGLAEECVVSGQADACTCLVRVLRAARSAVELGVSLPCNHNLFHCIWGRLTDLISILGPDGRRLYASPSHRRFLGDPAAVLGTDPSGELHPRDQERWASFLKKAWERGAVGPARFRVVLSDGSMRHMEVQGTAIPARDDMPGTLLLVGRDVSQQQRIEAELREREEFFRHISENMSDLVAVVDREGRRLYNSPSYRRLFGGHDPARASDSFVEIHPEDRSRIRRVFEETVATGEGQRAEFRFVLPDGSVRFLESVGSTIRDEGMNVAKVLVVSRDTTERRLAEEALARERNLLRTLVDQLPDFIYVKDREGRFVLNNLAHARLVGMGDPAPLLGKRDADVFPPELAAQYGADDGAVVEKGEPVMDREEPVRDPAGRRRWVLTSKLPLRDSQGQVAGLVGISRDITERREAEQALRESQERLELVIRGSRDGVWDWNLQTNEVYFSARWKSMLGYAEEEVANTFSGWQELLHPDDRERAMRTLRDYFDARTPQYELEHRLRHRDGSYRWILARGLVLRDAKGRPMRMAGTHVDLTERKRTEERLRQAARWESVTTLAAGVAHEVKNPLQTILLGVEFLATQSFANEPNVGGLLASMHNAARQADTIIRSLRDYAVQRQPQFRTCSLNTLIEATLGMMEFELDRLGIKRDLGLAPDLPDVWLDAEQIKQVCWTVFRNALDAMDQTRRERRLMVTTRQTLERPEFGSRTTPAGGGTAGRWVVMTVEDTGAGVAAADLPRVFDLFFSTKAAGKGTGIGLALARRVLEAHGGLIDLANRTEGGARLSLAVPVRLPDPAGVGDGPSYRSAPGPSSL